MRFDPDDDEYEELRAQALFERRYLNNLMRHPDCRDPDHPGCESCNEREEEEQAPPEDEDEAVPDTDL